MSRRLPVIVERSVTEIAVTRARIGEDFSRTVMALAQEDGLEPSCRKGCSNCCMHPVTVTVLEGLVIYRWLVSHGRWTPSLRKRLEQASDALLGLSFEVWLMSAQPCSFLVGGACSIYQTRPMQCRTAFSIAPPDQCHPHRLQPSTILPRMEPLDEFAEVEKRLLDAIGLQRFQVPLATAVLFAEKIQSGEYDVEQIDAKLMSLYSETA